MCLAGLRLIPPVFGRVFGVCGGGVGVCVWGGGVVAIKTPRKCISVTSLRVSNFRKISVYV